MNSLVDKVAALLPALEERGTVYLFAFAEREDIERWDIVMSSAWSDQDEYAAIKTIVDLLKPRLHNRELSMISRIAVIPSTDPRIQEIPEGLNGVNPEDHRVIHVSLLGSEVRRAFIFKAQLAPTELPKESPVANAA